MYATHREVLVHCLPSSSIIVTDAGDPLTALGSFEDKITGKFSFPSTRLSLMMGMLTLIGPLPGLNVSGILVKELKSKLAARNAK